jgi:hypothetical protein
MLLSNFRDFVTTEDGTGVYILLVLMSAKVKAEPEFRRCWFLMRWEPSSVSRFTRENSLHLGEYAGKYVKRIL